MTKFKSFYQCVQLLRRLFDPLWVVAVDHKYQTLKTNTDNIYNVLTAAAS